jgi:hypothetical protein
MHIYVGNCTQKCWFVSRKNFYPGGIRTQVFCSRGGCDVHCATHRKKVFLTYETSHWFQLLKLECKVTPTCKYICQKIIQAKLYIWHKMFTVDKKMSSYYLKVYLHNPTDCVIIGLILSVIIVSYRTFRFSLISVGLCKHPHKASKQLEVFIESGPRKWPLIAGRLMGSNGSFRRRSNCSDWNSSAASSAMTFRLIDHSFKRVHGYVHAYTFFTDQVKRTAVCKFCPFCKKYPILLYL